MISSSQGRHVSDFRSRDVEYDPAREVRRILFPYLLLILSQLPLCLVYLKVLWVERTHYVLFPVSLVACGLFIFTRWPRGETPLFFPSVKSDLFLITGIALGVLGTLFLSPWFGFASFLFLLGSLLARTNDRSVFGTLLPALAPLVVLLQPPIAIDFDTVQGDIQVMSSMNNASTKLASDILDLSRYAHNISGSRMEFKTGILDSTNLGNNSLSVFTLLIVTGLFIAWQRMSMFRATLLLLAACFWFFTFQGLSLVVCAIAEISFEKDFYSPGNASRILQVISLLSAGLMTLLSERLIAFLCGPVDIQAIDENISYQDILCRFWNSAIAGIVSPTIDVNVKKEVAWAKRRSSDPSAATSSLLWGAGILLGILCFIQITSLGVAISKSGNSVFANGALALNQNSMPTSLAGWNRSGYETTAPKPVTPFDTTAHRWTYTNESGIQCIVEVSQPWSGWHDQHQENKRNDWRVEIAPEQKEMSIGDETVRYLTAYYSDSLANYRLSLNFQVDGYGQNVVAPITWKDPFHFIGRCVSRSGISNRTRARVVSGYTCEVNVFFDSIGSSLNEDRERAEQLFIAAASHVYAAIQDGSINQPPADSQ